MENVFSAVLKIKICILLSLLLVISMLGFFCNEPRDVLAEPNSSYHYNFDVGDYVMTVIATSGIAPSSAGGRVQINGGTISGEESVTIAYQTSTTVQAYVNTGYEFTGWYTALLGGQLKTRNATFVFNMPSQNTTYYAIFTINRYLISAISSPIGAGNITGAGTHNYNSQVTITATPINSNYEFYRWIESGLVVSTSPSYLFTVTDNKNFIAEFKVKLSSTAGVGGSVNLNGGPNFVSGYFLQTQNVILEAIPNAGYKFVGWTSGSTSTSPTINVLVGTTAKTYVANFVLIGAQLFIEATDGGSVDGSEVGTNYPMNEIINLIATPEPNYHFVEWQGDYSGSLQWTSAETSYVVMLSDVTRGSLNFLAVFERNPTALTVYAITNATVSEVGGLVAIETGVAASVYTQMMTPETMVEISAITKNGYKFLGWYDAISGGQIISSYKNYEFLMPVAEVSYYAFFQMSFWYEYRISPVGDGSELNPYIINTENELAWIAYTTNMGLSWSNNIFVILNNNLNLSAYMWEPIGNSSTLSVNNKWQGNFNGGGYIISGLNINKQQTGVGYSGLFGSIYGDRARVFNLGLEDVSIIFNSNYNAYVGGISGQAENAHINNCYIKNAEITVNNNGTGHNYIGGIVGNNVNSQISDCFVVANIKTFNLYENLSYLGGITGNNYGANAVIENIYNIGSVKVDEYNSSLNTMYIGALIGYNSLGASLKNSYYSVEYAPINAVGVNNATEYYNFAKTLNELKNYSTYVNQVSIWNFEHNWIMPSTSYNDGYPVLRGVGNLVVNAQTSENGIITPIGQKIYFASGDNPVYTIAPNRNYEIESFFVNGEEQTVYQGSKNAQNYIIDSRVGTILLEAIFKEQVREPINIFMLLIILVLPILALLAIVRRVFDKKFDRRRRIIGAIKKYKTQRRR
ncbi:MAG: InlB B-repeat-containing protein [Clostridia bacterium]|nr:InlB B-repeat-containing protein [Clostridia bacterium]